MYLTCIAITQSTVTSPIGFNKGLTNVDARLKQRCINLVPTLCNVVSTLCNVFRRCFNVGHWCCISVVQRWKTDVGFFFIFNVRSTLFQLWSTTLKQRWSNVKMLAGLKFSFVFILIVKFHVSYWMQESVFSLFISLICVFIK